MGLKARISHSYSIGGLRRGQIAFRLRISAGSACQHMAACRHIRRYASKCFTIRHCSRHHSQFWQSAVIIRRPITNPAVPVLVVFPDSGGLTGLLQGNSCPYINVRYRALTCPDSPRIKQPRRNANRVTTGVFGVTKSAFPAAHSNDGFLCRVVQSLFIW